MTRRRTHSKQNFSWQSLILHESRRQSVILGCIGMDEASPADKLEKGAGKDLIEEEEVEEGAVSVRTYRGYMRYYGGCLWWSCVCACFSIFNLCDRFAIIWLTWFSDVRNPYAYPRGTTPAGTVSSRCFTGRAIS